VALETYVLVDMDQLVVGVLELDIVVQKLLVILLVLVAVAPQVGVEVAAELVLVAVMVEPVRLLLTVILIELLAKR
jgi:hypothetical protein